MFLRSFLVVIYTLVIALISTLITCWYYNNHVLGSQSEQQALIKVDNNTLNQTPLLSNQLVVEVFSYGCHFCALNEKPVQDLEARLPNGMNVLRIHLTNSDNSGLATYAPIFATLSVMGIEGQYREKIYDAALKNKIDLTRNDKLMAWLEKNNIDVMSYQLTRESQEVKEQLAFMAAVSKKYNITATPVFIINRKWISLQDRDYPAYADHLMSLLNNDKPLEN